jgi:hypothetical protein
VFLGYHGLHILLLLPRLRITNDPDVQWAWIPLLRKENVTKLFSYVPLLSILPEVSHVLVQLLYQGLLPRGAPGSSSLLPRGETGSSSSLRSIA